MGRLIDANEFEKFARKHCKDSLADLWCELIKMQPTVDAEPVRHGKWIFGETKGHSWMKCDQCLKSQSGQTACFTYCPNCGCRMDAE